MKFIKDTIKEAFSSPSYWLDLFLIYTVTAINLLLNMNIWSVLGTIILSASIFSILTFRILRKDHDIRRLHRKLKSWLKRAKKTADAGVVYDGIIDEILPALRKNLPQTIYKYYWLDNNESLNEAKLDSLAEDMIWMAQPSHFNDPFEGNYMSLSPETLEKEGFPPQATQLWDQVIEKIRQHITITCFTQNPNDMPMWAHYANNHHGFCVAYQVNNPYLLYPVFYAKNRLESLSLFINLIYELFSKNTTEFKSFRHVIFLSAFKDASWESEHEVRAIMLSTADEISDGGCLYSCEQLGLQPVKIYAGVLCAPQHVSILEKIAADKKIEYERCELSRTSFSVVK